MSVLISLMFMMSLALVVLPGSVYGLLARGLITGASILTLAGLGSSGWRINHAERRWLVLGMTYVICGVFSTMDSSRPELGWLDAARQAFMVATTFVLMVHFRRMGNSRVFRKLLVIPALIGAITLIGGFLLIMGPPSPANLMEFAAYKFEMDARYGLNPNPLSFAMLLAFVLNWQGYGRRWWFYPYSLTVLLALVLSGALTSILALGVAGGIAWLLRRPPSKMVVLFMLPIAALAFVAGATILDDQALLQALYWLSDVTTGRSELWSGALAKFMDKPFLGWGALTWDTDLTRYLTLYSSNLERFTSLDSGAFHNAYLTILTEKGLLGFSVSMIMLIYVLRASLWLFWKRQQLHGDDRLVAALAPTWVLLLVVRGLSEHGGLLGYANGGVDFMAYAGAALVLAASVRSNTMQRTKREVTC
ncbi:O-antigen ligase family protein [Accumulibacter sp.]|uniref:O-antigen polymerase n=1 Tax=Accumulibacter regalis TaxID=522306 RepID=C7RIE3_ACCRE|nr:O-antigen ligase family protein [Accumulibacter sp.]MBN8496666.1 O-antigen ligase family protein [Accumulibacter sp.]MBO3716472.1 O-antigen ligase family protein [Accumulibacter sp.]